MDKIQCLANITIFYKKRNINIEGSPSQVKGARSSLFTKVSAHSNLTLKLIIWDMGKSKKGLLCRFHAWNIGIKKKEKGIINYLTTL
jgi:hypothetical protein